MGLRWTSALSVGDPEIDLQHQELFRRVDRLIDGMLRNDRSEAVRLMGFLREHAVVHFAVEERLMVETAFPDAARHIQLHRAFHTALKELDTDLRALGPTTPLVLRLEGLATTWLRDHLYSADLALGRWIRGRQGKAAAPQP